MATSVDQLVVELKADISGLRSDMQNATKVIQTFADTADKSGQRVRASTIAMGVGMERAITTIVTSLGRFAGSVVDVGIKMQALQNRMTAATGSVEASRDAMKFTHDEARRLGLDVVGLTEDFAGFTASAMRNGFSLDQSKKIFSGVSEGLAALGVDTTHASLAFLALEQMAGKGVIQLQEVKQLVNAVPGSLEIMAHSLGMTTQQFNEMVSKGQVLAQDALPKLADAFHNQFGERAAQAANSAQGAVNNLNNAVIDLKTHLAQSGVLDGYTAAIKELDKAAQGAAGSGGLQNVGALIGEIGKLAAASLTFLDALIGRLRGVQDNSKLAQQAIQGIKASGQAGYGPIDSSGGLLAGSGSASGGLLVGGTQTYSDVGSAIFGGLGISGEGSLTGNKGGGGKGGISGGAGQLESLKKELAGETEALQLEYDKRQKLLELSLKNGELTKQQYRDLSFKNEVKYKNDYAELYAQQEQERIQQEQEVADAINSIRRGTMETGIGLLQTLGQKNKAFAIAAIALEKAKGIAEVLIASRVAAAKALAIYGPTPQGFALAAEATAFGYVQAGLIAATGLAEVAQMGAGGKGSSDGSSGSVADGVSTTVNGVASSGSSQVKNVTLVLNGNYWSAKDMRDFADTLNEFIGEGSVRLNVAGAA